MPLAGPAGLVIGSSRPCRQRSCLTRQAVPTLPQYAGCAARGARGGGGAYRPADAGGHRWPPPLGASCPRGRGYASGPRGHGRPTPGWPSLRCGPHAGRPRLAPHGPSGDRGPAAFLRHSPGPRPTPGPYQPAAAAQDAERTGPDEHPTSSAKTGRGRGAIGVACTPAKAAPIGPWPRCAHTPPPDRGRSRPRARTACACAICARVSARASFFFN